MASDPSVGPLTKRHKNSENGDRPPNDFPQMQPFPPQQSFSQPPYGGPRQFPMQPQPGYNMWPGPGQQQQPPPYGNPQWQHGQQPPFRHPPPSGGPPNGFRGQPSPQLGGPPPQGRNMNGKHGDPSGAGGMQGGLHPSQQFWGHPQQQPPSQQQSQQMSMPPQQQQPPPQQQQWGQQPWQAGHPPIWRQGPLGVSQQGPSPSPPQAPQHIQGTMQPHPKMWSGGNQMGGVQESQPSGSNSGGLTRPRSSPDSLGSRIRLSPSHQNSVVVTGLSPDALCKPVGGDSDAPRSVDDDEKRKSSGASISSKDKGRGSYRCGKCGEPKRGHVCPYQPKIQRRPDEPPPETRCAAIQVEMDEFMTLRRLNIEIQGLPESYATTAHLAENMVIGEPHAFGGGSNTMMLGAQGHIVDASRVIGAQASHSVVTSDSSRDTARAPASATVASSSPPAASAGPGSPSTSAVGAPAPSAVDEADGQAKSASD